MMKKTRQIISIVLLIPVVALTFPLQPKVPCNTEQQTTMSCCSNLAQAVEVSGVNFSSGSCHCNLAQASRAEVPIANAPTNNQPNLKILETGFVSACLQTNSGTSWANSSHFNVFPQSHSFQNIKIYDLIASYLI